MTTRDELREAGAAVRRQLGLADHSGAELAPGLPSLLDEVVFGRLWARPGLTLQERMLSTLCALTSVQRLPQLSRYVGAALHIGMQPRLIQEVMLHCAMYAGMPTAENALDTVSAVFRAHGVAVTDTEIPRRELDELTQLGDETMRDLHAERAEGGYAAPESAAAALYATAIQYLYGEVWNRPGITRRERMICSVAAFTATQMSSQQSKFFRSALNVGLTRQEVLEIIMQTGPYSGFPPALNALAVAEAALPAD